MTEGMVLHLDHAVGQMKAAVTQGGEGHTGGLAFRLEKVSREDSAEGYLGSSSNKERKEGESEDGRGCKVGEKTRGDSGEI